MTTDPRTRTPCRVFLVYPDAVLRASIARAMVSGGFDVTAVTSSDELVDSIVSDTSDRMIVIIDLDQNEALIESTLRTMTNLYPNVGVVARTDRGPISAEAILSMVEIDRSVIVPRTATEVELVGAARRILPTL